MSEGLYFFSRNRIKNVKIAAFTYFYFVEYAKCIDDGQISQLLSILFYSILSTGNDYILVKMLIACVYIESFYSILFYSILFFSILFYSTLLYYILFYSFLLTILFYPQVMSTS